ncbi:LuxR C-terminal-related transcriptional regulator [Sessilibacter corallicola]|uniref:HTH luxR-type domain-containing protein n=1 Tax=Sessilibacter corallicola TaxID=2904075 RepID=A0ABQ0A4J3_9GAMM
MSVLLHSFINRDDQFEVSDLDKLTSNASQLIDLIDQHIFCKHLNGEYIFCNRSFAKLAGITEPKAIAGLTDADLVWSAQTNEIARFEQQLLHSKKSTLRQQEQQIRTSGMVTILISRTILLFKGKPKAIIANFSDLNNHLILKTSGVYDYDTARFHLQFVPESLSYTELKVCYYIIQGFTVTKIAEKTGTSVRTVRFHIDNIKNKMNCSKKEQIIQLAMETGIAWKIFSISPNLFNGENSDDH